MKEKKFIIYKITNIITGKSYIGRTKQDLSNYWGSGKLIQNSVLKNGKENFIKEILEICKDRQHSLERERFWIQELNTIHPNGYNLSLGGEDGGWYHLLTEEQKQERSLFMSEIMKKEWRENYVKRRNSIRKSMRGPRRQQILEKMKLSIRRYWTKDKREEVSKRFRKLWSDEDKRQLQSKKLKNYFSSLTEEEKRVRSEFYREKFNDPTFKEVHKEKIKNGREKAEQNRILKGEETTSQKNSKRFTKYNNEVKWTKEEREKRSRKNIENWSNPEFKRKASEKIKSKVNSYYEKGGERLRKEIGEKTKNRPKTTCPLCDQIIQVCRLRGHFIRIHKIEESEIRENPIYRIS